MIAAGDASITLRSPTRVFHGPVPRPPAARGRAVGRSGHVRPPLVQDQFEAGAQVVPPLSERRDGGVAAAYFERDGAGGECFLQLVEPWNLTRPAKRRERNRQCIIWADLSHSRATIAKRS